MQGIINPALAELRILFENALQRAYMLSHFVFIAAILLSYMSLGLGTTLSHLPLPSFAVLAPFLCNHLAESDKNNLSEHSKWIDYVEDLGGDGPKVAAYLRISKKKKESFSLEAQRDAINKMKNERKPSKVYWFIDDGKSSKSPEDFDKLKINSIWKLRERKEIQELWVFKVNRMGRVCRKLLYFYLDFCDDGGIIRDSEKSYDLKELASIITFVLEAHAAQKANEDRAAAAMAGKARAFKQKRWNKPTPKGYKKIVWLQKQPDFDQLINDIYNLFLKEGNLESARKGIGNFAQLLPKPLTVPQIRRILSDPVYIGKPEHLGEVVSDPDLAFVDEETFRKSLEILTKIQERCKTKRLGPLENCATSTPITFLQILEKFELHHRGCGGVVWKNGTTNDEGPWQQLFQCKERKKFWRLPPIKVDQNKRKTGAFDKDSMGGLNFDTVLPKTLKNRKTEKDGNCSSDLTSQRLSKAESVVLLGNPINYSLKSRKKNPKKSIQNDGKKTKREDQGQNKTLENFRSGERDKDA